MSIAIREFQLLAAGNPICCMYTAAEIRRIRLEILIKRYASVAALNAELGWPRTDPKLAQIRNANPRADRAKPYQMGDAMARDIEKKLQLERGWMDTPPSYAELHGENDPRTKAMELFEALPPEEWATALRLLSALEKPAAKNGTED